MVLDTQGHLFRLENLERRVALGRIIRLHPDLPPTLVVAEGQPCYWKASMVETELRVGT